MGNAIRDGNPALAPEALLELARTQEERRQHGDALLSYYRAIIESQRQGLRYDRSTTPPAILDRVTHAMRFVRLGTRMTMTCSMPTRCSL